MIETHHYCSGRVEHVTVDGAHWREATPGELRRLLREEPEHRVILGHRGNPCPASEYADLYLAGGYPFLAGIAALLPVFVEVECLKEAE